MENTQRLEDVRRAGAARPAAPGRGVPADWFLDPADPEAGSRLTGSGLEDQATAFLSTHGLAEDGSEAVDAGATVTALHPGPAAAPAVAPSQTASSAWLGLPGVLEPEEIEGELAWQVDALCAQTDPEAFFPEKGGSTRDAKKVCSSCTVRSECLDYAMQNDERFGIWGGLSERERRRLRKSGYRPAS